jgi:hypothetical protein
VTIDKTTCGEREALVEYLYGESARDERVRFEAHLALCADCRQSLEELRAVRSELAGWDVPVLDGTEPGLRAGAAFPKGGGYARPWWASGALAAAAVILLAVAAAIANLEITYGSGGVSVRTGWSREPAAVTTGSTAPASVQNETPPVRGSGELSAVAVPGAPSSPWRDDLSALERRLRTEFQAAPTNAARATPLSAESARLLQRVQDLIEQSEVRQRRELALRMAQVVRDFDTQRQTDLVRIQQGLGQIEGNTAADRQILNYLVRASQRQ